MHRVTRIIKSLGLTYPEKGVGFGGKFNFTSSPAEIPDTLNILLDYPGGPTVQLISSMANDTPVPHLLRGHKATLEFTRTGFTITPQRQFESEAKMYVHIKSGGERTELHHQNLLDAIRIGAALKCDCELGNVGRSRGVARQRELPAREGGPLGQRSRASPYDVVNTARTLPGCAGSGTSLSDNRRSGGTSSSPR